ncbi:MAG: hypothetical protein OEU54_14170 [Gemmatimonadota bacterium]|nr:hypothetical protein [Gemmatimonadota bacterium]
MRTTRSGSKTWSLVLAVGLPALFACSADSSSREPVELRFAGDAPEATFVVDYDQEIAWGIATLERTYGARYALTGLGSEDGDVRLGARLDSLFVVHSTPHGRGVVDARHLEGAEFQLSVPTSGGRPGYPDDAPVLLMPGNLEGELSVGRFMDFAFPALPEESVGVGDTWVAESEHPHVEAHVHATARVRTEYRLAGWEVVDGVECARIEGRLTGDVVAAPYEQYGATVEFSGTLEGDVIWLFDVEAGALVSATGETSSDGMLTSDGTTSTIRQQTRIGIAR